MRQREGKAAAGAGGAGTGSGATWSRGKPPARPATPADWEVAPRICSLAWAAWLVGMNASTFSQLMNRDPLLRDRLSYRGAAGGQRWYFSARVWDWVDGRQWGGLRLVAKSSPDPPA